MASRCPIHHVAVGPDGVCVLCRRQREGQTASRDAPRSATLAWVIGAAAAALVLLVALGWWKNSNRSVTASEPAPAVSVAAAPSLIEEADDTPDPSSAWGDPGKLPTAPEATRHAAVGLAATAMVPGSADDALHPRTQAELQAAMREVPIQMYSTSSCADCAPARSWLNANHITFADHDVEHDPAARKRQLSLDPTGSVPTIDVDGETVIGFSRESLGVAIKHAVDRRLARH